MSNEINDLIAEAREFLQGKAQSYGYTLIRRLADALEAATRVPVQGEPNDDREALARVLYIARDDFALPDRMAKAWDAPGPHGRQRWYRYADAVLAAGFSRAAVPDAANEELRADEMTANEAIEQVLKRPGMYGLVPKNEHRSMKAERDAVLARITELEVERAEILGFIRVKAKANARWRRLVRATIMGNEARIAEAEKLHRESINSASALYPTTLCKCGVEWPCPTAVSLGLNEGENGVS